MGSAGGPSRHLGPALLLSATVRRRLLENVSRIVVKLGTGVLTDASKLPDLDQMAQLVAQLAALCKSGKEVVVVSSGAVGAGMGVLEQTRRPSDLAALQACAAVGQCRLMGTYEDLFSRHGLHVGQVLLTHFDLAHRDFHLNARNTLINLLDRGVVPVINENDTTSFTELRFGDNDRLSALAACLLPSDVLIVLTTEDGLIENYGAADARVIGKVDRINEAVEKLAGGTRSHTSVGGMNTKIEAARIVMRAGIPMIIAPGHKPDVLSRVCAGEEEGTIFVPRANKLEGRKRWIAFFHHPKGALFVDDGAKKALREKGRSLLPPGILRCEGTFGMGEVVRIRDEDGTEFARGLVAFDSRAIRSRKIPRTELVHRNNLVIL